MSLFLVFFAFSANAHHPEIVAEAFCDPATGEFFIEYTSTPWADCSGLSCENTRVDILFNGVIVDSGAYAGPDYSFTNTLPVPAGSEVGDVISVTALAVDDWGNGTPGGQSTSTQAVIPDDPDCDSTGTGRFTGGGHQIRVDNVRVTRGLTVHCDLLLSNNLNINWKGNHFHMEDHLVTVACTDDPDIEQAPPAAPIDTLIGRGIGRYNGEDGYTIEFTLIDGGEPGRFRDMAQFLVYETADPSNVILDVPLQYITGGNLQAHEDQPHGHGM
jgi:hypothetical protein